MADIQLLEYVGYVGLGGAFVNGQVRCDLFVGGPYADQLQNLELAFGEGVAAAIGSEFWRESWARRVNTFAATPGPIWDSPRWSAWTALNNASQEVPLSR